MVATNILSLYHQRLRPPPPPAPHHTRHHNPSSSAAATPFLAAVASPKHTCNTFDFSFAISPNSWPTSPNWTSPSRSSSESPSRRAPSSARMKLYNVTVLTTTMSLGEPYSEAVALQQRLPVFDGVVDLVRCGNAVNRWIPVTEMEFLLFDLDRVLRGGGYFWIDRSLIFSKEADLERVYGPMILKLGYKKVKWATGHKTVPGRVNNREVYLTALLQKPLSK